MKPLNSLGELLKNQIVAAELARQSRHAHENQAEKVHIVGAGGAVTAAYEQLRNVAENAEEHVLLQRAIERFFRRTFMTSDEKFIQNPGEELAIELTHAGYLPNDTIPVPIVEQISARASEYFRAHQVLAKSHPRTADAWTIGVVSAEVENLLQPDEMVRVFVQFCHEYFRQQIADGAVFNGANAPEDTELSLYVAIHLALQKSDPSLIRLGLLARFSIGPENPQYVIMNQKIDGLLSSATTEKLAHYVDRHGAPLRILEAMLHDRDDIVSLLEREHAFLDAFEAETVEEYDRISKKITHGVVRSVMFLVITKFLLGLAIEVPYDRWAHGSILWTPLLINLLFPPIYMVLLRLTMGTPGRANTERLASLIEKMLYEPPAQKQLQRRRQSRTFGVAYDIVYGVAFVAVFGGVALLLWRVFGFGLLHLAIFFVFLSAASFLGFRLSRLIRELEAIDTRQTGWTTARDFLYMPFVVMGRWISDKYSRLNLITMILDMLIELPLKTTLRLIRQWAAFISSKQDQL